MSRNKRPEQTSPPTEPALTPAPEAGTEEAAGPPPGAPPGGQARVGVDDLLKAIGTQTVEINVLRMQAQEMRQGLMVLFQEKTKLEAELKELRPKEEGEDPEEQLDPD